MDASRDFLFLFLFFIFSPNEQRGGGGRGGGGGSLPDFFLFFFPFSADHERDWPPCKVVFFRVGNQCAECEKQQQPNTKSETCSEQYCIKFPNGMTCGKMLLDCMAISLTPCLMRYYIASGFVFLVYLVPAPSETCWFRGMSVGGSFLRV